MRAILRAASLCVIAGCGFVRPPTEIENLEPQFGVFSLVRAGSDTISVLVARFPATGQVEGVSGATVKFIAASDTLVLIEQPASDTTCARNSFDGNALSIAGCYRAALPSRVQIGATYGLVADVPGFGRIVGSTRVPTPPTITSPAEGARIAAAHSNGQFPAIPLRVEAPADAERLEATLTARDPNRRCEAFFIRYFGGAFGVLVLNADESETIEAQFLANCFTQSGPPQPLGELPAVVRATTFDSAYARFAEVAFDRSSGSILQRHARAGIDRGVGYFAGSATAEVRIVLTGSGT